MMTKIYLLVGALAGLAAATPAAAQSVFFQSTPLSNTCAYPWAMTLQPQVPPPAITLAPGAATVVTKNVTGVQTPHGLFVPVANRQINPGNLCFFENCIVGTSITLTCAPVGAKGAPAAGPKTSSLFNLKK